MIVAKTQPLFTGAEQKHGDRVLGEVEKSSFYCFARQRGLPWRPCDPPWRRGSEEFYSVQEAGRDPLMDGSWMVGIKVKFQASLTFWLQPG